MEKRARIGFIVAMTGGGAGLGLALTHNWVGAGVVGLVGLAVGFRGARWLFK